MGLQHVRNSGSGRKILLSVTGLSPQVVTETLYATAVASSEPWIPDEVHLVTTAQGAEQARLSLLSDSPGWFARLRRDYDLPPIQFGIEQIHVICDRDGAVLDDIRNPADNDAAADFITEVVRRLTLDPDSAVHASIAGGRKTMGFYLGYAMSLYGRPQDRLSHVLVSAPFENLREFFYPTPREFVLHVERNGKPQSLDAHTAKVTLADIPFVRLRDGQPRHLIEGRASFSQSVAAAQRSLQPARLSLDLAHGKLFAGDVDITLPPAELAFYAMLARRAKAGGQPLRWTDDDLRELYLAEYGAIVGRHSGHFESTEQRLAGDIHNWFNERKSKCERALRSVLDAAAARPYLIKTYGKRPHTRYGLALAPESIAFAGRRKS